MEIQKEDLIKLMQDTVKSNWFNPSMIYIDAYERAITIMSGGNSGETPSYEGHTEDIEKLMLHINDYPDFKILNVYDIIHKHYLHPWGFMKVMKGE